MPSEAKRIRVDLETKQILAKIGFHAGQSDRLLRQVASLLAGIRSYFDAGFRLVIESADKSKEEMELDFSVLQSSDRVILFDIGPDDESRLIQLIERYNCQSLDAFFCGGIKLLARLREEWKQGNSAVLISKDSREEIVIDPLPPSSWDDTKV